MTHDVNIWKLAGLGFAVSLYFALPHFLHIRFFFFFFSDPYTRPGLQVNFISYYCVVDSDRANIIARIRDSH